MPREVLLQRVERFQGLAVLRPDGYLAWALTGETQQRVAPVEWKDGAFRAHAFEVGRFYSGRNGMAFFAVDEQLRDQEESACWPRCTTTRTSSAARWTGPRSPSSSWPCPSGKLVSHPIQSVGGLEATARGRWPRSSQNSPEYLERFQLMTRGEQIRALSKLSTTLLSTYGAAGGTTRTMAAAGRGLEAVSVPALTLTAEGALAVERVAVPAGRVVTALSGGPGAAIILQRANDAARRGSPRLRRALVNGGPPRSP